MLSTSLPVRHAVAACDELVICAGAESAMGLSSAVIGSLGWHLFWIFPRSLRNCYSDISAYPCHAEWIYSMSSRHVLARGRATIVGRPAITVSRPGEDVTSAQRHPSFEFSSEDGDTNTQN